MGNAHLSTMGVKKTRVLQAPNVSLTPGRRSTAACVPGAGLVNVQVSAPASRCAFISNLHLERFRACSLVYHSKLSAEVNGDWNPELALSPSQWLKNLQSFIFPFCSLSNPDLYHSPQLLTLFPT